MSERQKIESSPSPSAHNGIPLPPSYDEISGIFVSETYNGSTDSVDYFLGEVNLMFHWYLWSHGWLFFSNAVTLEFLTVSFWDMIGYAFIPSCNWCGVKSVNWWIRRCAKGFAHLLFFHAWILFSSYWGIQKYICMHLILHDNNNKKCWGTLLLAMKI